MNTNNKIYSFFITLALLFWNPLSFYLFYSNTLVYSELVIHIFYWIIFLSGILLVIIMQKDKLGEKFKNIAFAIAIIGIIYSTFVIIDRVFGLVTKNEIEQIKKQEWQLFEPNTTARYKTSEYEYIVNINSLGFRDRETNIEKGDKFRICCVGDSWTYGWGVNIENSWPKILEQYLHSNVSENIEVINFGRPDQYTSTYKKYMAQTVPLLKPDIVLVSVLQLDDLAQLYPDTLTSQNLFKKDNSLKDFAKKNKKNSYFKFR